MNKDIYNSLSPKQAIAPAAHTADVTGLTVDRKDAEANVIALNVGTITDGTHTPKLQESDDDSAWSDVAADDQLGALVALSSDEVQKVAYKGYKRYFRVFVTVSGTTTGGVYSAQAVLGKHKAEPV